ncbi:helix-turn-helix domain-containing protein [Streptomyces sp. NPDC053079]|uniref:helix-turn-helix domain-containing protein n=1 Tax=Streptomyces sp. NPDC053079 TaxID=3365697 RepID=UPI0037D281F5
MTNHLTFGQRLKFYRDRRELTQRELGELVGRSEDWVYRVESDRIPVERIKMLTDLADALRIHVEDLQGSPALLDDYGDHKGSVPAIRAALMQSRRLSGDLFDRREVPRLERVEVEVDQAWRLYQASQYARLGEVLPGLLADVRLAVHRGPSELRRKALRQFALALHVAAVYLRKLGETNLAWTAVDQGDVAASDLGDPAVILALRRGVAHVQLGAGLPQEAVNVTLDAALDVAPGWWRSSSTALSVYGTLFLNGAMAAARMEDAQTTGEMLGKAKEAADRLGGEGNEMWTSFGPANVQIHRLATALEFENVDDALGIASQAKADRLAVGLPVERQARLRLDMARAFGMANRTDDAVDSLKRAFRTAPEQMRAHELARDLARRLAKQTRQEDVHELALCLDAIK